MTKKDSLLMKIFRVSASLKLAVIVILALTFSLITATFLESAYDTPTAQYFVYRSLWFHCVLALLGINIFNVAMSRLPWKRSHIPFLLAHLGILTLLAGSWITEKYGVDASLRISEGEITSAVEYDLATLVMSERTSVQAYAIPWLPPEVKFKSVSFDVPGGQFDLKIDQYLSHADSNVSFVPENDSTDNRAPAASRTGPAVQFRLTGGPMGISQELWLWGGDPNWSAMQAGPAYFVLGKEVAPMRGRPHLELLPDKNGNLIYHAYSSAGKKVEGKFKLNELAGKPIEPGWKGVKITMLQWIPNAFASTTYKPARVMYGKDAPPSAIHITASPKGDPTHVTQVWLGMGDRATLHAGDKDVDLGYYPKRTILPFSVRLDRFNIDHYEGTRDPSEFSSQVTVLDRDHTASSKISMNEPLTYSGYTLYQASYEDGQPRPVTSIFSVNRDPGRPWKYIGSLLIVLGAILLFADKYRRKGPKLSTGAVA